MKPELGCDVVRDVFWLFVHQTTLYTPSQPRLHTQGQDNTNDLLWGKTTITDLHSKILISHKFPLLRKHILNTSA
jgi:hypothetical protein